ncbi:ribonuclease H [Alkalicoccobacillus plakortidis]|uniref:Ribonuclease H n=1 Tax=Alkalicoccobacillus plakortidis TaxID=444060 RepID=A0ABT0XN96_9BACI|nr:ribonuclease H family protein [Alkalicoccobacillus plakortidis]MCM2676798.1 ribonuclease H family protein [Alkalicoccobacillus plakortidis]
MAKGKFYVVWKGIQPGIYTSWAECEAQVKGFPGARFKSFPTKAEAEEAFQSKPGSRTATKKTTGTKTKKESVISEDKIIWESISVDVGSRGNPGIVEYKGVDTKTGEILFSHGEIHIGTNNMGEFLAIVHALAYLYEQNDSTTPVYSDSKTAIKWVKDRKANSSLERSIKTEEMWLLIDRAEKWLRENRYSNPILKWETKHWGEIKADYGRK